MGVHPVQKPIRAITLRLLAALLFAVMAMLIKLAGESGASLVEIMFWRQAVTVPLVLGWLGAGGQLALLRTERKTAHARRALIGMICMTCNFGATLLLPLALATALGFAAPLFAVLLGALVWHERIGPWRWSAVLLGFVGVLLITRPGAAGFDPVGAAAGLAAALLVALLNFLIRDLGRSEPVIRTVFYFAAVATVVLAPLQLVAAQPHPAQTWALLIGIGLTGTAGQLCLTGSLRHGAVTSIIALDYSALIWSSLLGWAVWNHLPGGAFWIGAPMIVAAGLAIAWREHRIGKQPVLAQARQAQ